MPGPDDPGDPRLLAAREYVARGWQVFVLNPDKSPLANCPDCPRHNEVVDADTGERHDAELCACLTCHGFYAATRDLVRLELMLERHPNGLLALRTGLASGLVVIDGEGSRDAPGEPTGVEVLDDWETWTSTARGDGFRLPPTLRQRTSGGGVHLVYRLPPGLTVKSRNRVLPSVDVKAEGGYVAVPPGAGREWLDDLDALASPSTELLTWLHGARGRGRSRAVDPGGGGREALRGEGYDFDAFVRDGCPAGSRDEFVNDFVFRLRTAGTPRQFTETALRQAWQRMQQPPGNEFTWEDCLAKVDHVYRTVEPDDGSARSGSGSTPGWSGSPRPAEPPPAWGAVEPVTGSHATATAPEPGSAPASLPSGGSPAVLGSSPAQPHRNTDRANGLELARFLAGRACWVPELDWHVFDGTRWVHDTREAHVRLVNEYVDLTRQLVTGGVVPEAEAEVTLARLTRLESASGLRGALTFARPELAVPVVEFDRDPWLLNCPNGTLDLRTGELHEHRAADRLTRRCPTTYDPQARDEVWERVLEELVPDPAIASWLQRFAGYCLTGLTDEKLFLVAKGPRDTGKSTVAEAFLRTLGDTGTGGYATVWSSEVVQHGTQVNRAEKLSKSRGARLVVVGELAKGSRMADEFVKSFTGGETLDARELYRNSYALQPTGKLWMATNYVPSSPDPALQVRLGLVPFEQRLARKDPLVKRHLDTDANAHAAVLAWAVRGCLAWQREGTLGPRPWLEQELAEYALDSDPVLQFLTEECVRVAHPAESASTQDVWSHYSITWAPQNVRRPLLRRKFEAALREHGVARYRVEHGGVRRMVWSGIRLRTLEERDD